MGLLSLDGSLELRAGVGRILIASMKEPLFDAPLEALVEAFLDPAGSAKRARGEGGTANQL